MKKYAVIVAGGSGQRMGTQVPKQFLLLHGRPVLWYTLNVFLRAYEDLDIILVAPEEHMETAKAMIYATEEPHRIRMIGGGATRWHSVRNGLQPIREEAVIFVHDGVRCLLSTELVHNCYEQALLLGSAIPVVDSRDSVRVITGVDSAAIERSRVKLVQTPQTFLSNILLPAYAQEYQESFTDEASVVEAYGGKVNLIAGEVNNIKITTPIDLVIAEKLLT
jgi:2-C-methyl-D-erythritol 4-phosphate cytidylyltransferase